MNVLHPCDGERLSLAMYLATVVCPISMPSLSSSPCAPERVGYTDIVNEPAYLERCLQPTPARPRSPAPIGPEASAVPADHGLRLDDLQSIEHSWGQMIEPGKHQAVNVSKGRSLGRFSSQNIELVSKQEDFGFQRSPRPK
jgi:hypothetical protein